MFSSKWPKNPCFFSPKLKKKMKKQDNKKMTTLEGMMTYSRMDNGLHTFDFAAYDCGEMEAFVGDCRVQAMRDGNVYITEKPKRMRNKALFREDNSTLTLGRDGRFYFVFTMEEGQVKQLPDALVHQALSIAQKVSRVVLKKKEVKT